MKYLSSENNALESTNYQHAVKVQNMQRAFNLIRAGRCTSRAELVKALKLSATAVSTITEELIRAGVVLETGTYSSSVPGRRPVRLTLNSESHQIAIFSLSTRCIRCTIFDMAFRVIEEFTIPCPTGLSPADDSGDTYAALFEDALLRKSRHFDREKAIVIGICYPGVYIGSKQAFYTSSAMGARFSESSMRRLEERIGIPMFLANSSMCLTYAEVKTRDSHNSLSECDLIFVNVCDGIGAGIIINGDMLCGTYNTAGELGHISIDHNGPVCSCGNTGCLEQYVSQGRILQRVRAACAAEGIAEPDSIESISSICREEFVQPIFRDIADKLACGVFSLMCATGIRRVVLGGGVEALGPDFLEYVRASLSERHILSENLKISYAKAKPSQDSFGLAAYFMDKIFQVRK